MHDDYEFDHREDDDMPPEQVIDVTMTLGDGGTVDATTDGTLIFSDEKTGRSFEVGFASAVAVMRLLREVALAGEEVEYQAVQQRRADEHTARRLARTANHPSVFAVLTEGVTR